MENLEKVLKKRVATLFFTNNEHSVTNIKTSYVLNASLQNSIESLNFTFIHYNILKNFGNGFFHLKNILLEQYITKKIIKNTKTFMFSCAIT